MFAYKSQVSETVARDFARQVLTQNEVLKEAVVSIASTIVLAGGLYWAYRISGSSWMIGALGTLGVFGLLATVLQLARYRAIASQVRAPRQIKIDDFGLSVVTPDIEVIRPWHSIRAVRERTDYLMLRTGEKTYVCLPTEEMPPGAREYVVEHVWGSLRPSDYTLERAREG